MSLVIEEIAAWEKKSAKLKFSTPRFTFCIESTVGNAQEISIDLQTDKHYGTATTKQKRTEGLLNELQERIHVRNSGRNGLRERMHVRSEAMMLDDYC
jgi:hypothetical protein